MQGTGFFVSSCVILNPEKKSVVCWVFWKGLGDTYRMFNINTQVQKHLSQAMLFSMVSTSHVGI